MFFCMAVVNKVLLDNFPVCQIFLQILHLVDDIFDRAGGWRCWQRGDNNMLTFFFVFSEKFYRKFGGSEILMGKNYPCLGVGFQ